MPSAARRQPGASFAGAWSAQMQPRVAAVLMDLGTACAASQDVLRSVLQANAAARRLDWLGVVRAALAAPGGWPVDRQPAERQRPPAPDGPENAAEQSAGGEQRQVPAPQRAVSAAETVRFRR